MLARHAVEAVFSSRTLSFRRTPARNGPVHGRVWRDMRPVSTPAVVAFLHLVSCVAAADLHVSASAGSGGNGTKAAPFANLAVAANGANPGDVIHIAPGVYKSDEPVRLSRSGTAEQPIRIEADAGPRPVFDFSSQTFASRRSGIEVRGDWWHVSGLEVTGAAQNGIRITGHHNRIERCATHDNQDTGLHLTGGASHNLVLDCESYHNVDRPTRGENADGFSAKHEIGPGNLFRGCRAWENADDGWDLWKATSPVRIEYCFATRNGLNLWDIPGFTGNGNGFKIGGDYVAAPHVVIGCVATDQPVRGFDQNNNMDGQTVERCVAVRCRIGFAFSKTTKTGRPHVLRDNLSWDAPARLVQGTVQERNTWHNADGSAAEAVMLPPTNTFTAPPRPPKTQPGSGK